MSGDITIPRELWSQIYRTLSYYASDWHPCRDVDGATCADQDECANGCIRYRTPARQLTDAIRAAGGIVHSDGNIFFTNEEKFLKAARAAVPTAEPDEANERATFERWAEGLLLPAGLNHPFLRRRSDGEYAHEWAAARWEAWQTRALMSRYGDCSYWCPACYDAVSNPTHRVTTAAPERSGTWARSNPEPSSPSGWRPIEEAPRDGTEILAWREDAGQFLAKWTCAADLRTMTDRERDELDEDSLFQWDWFGGDAELGGYRLEGSEVPTHFQPLPPPPGASPERSSPARPMSDEKEGSVSPGAQGGEA